MVWQYYVKSRKAQDYRQMLLDTLYHPPYIELDPEKTKNNHLYLVHHFEGKPLVKEYIANTMMGIEYLWGAPVQFETSEIVKAAPKQVGVFTGTIPSMVKDEPVKTEIKWERVLYTMKDRKLSREVIK